MGLRILTDENDDYAAFYCSTSMWALGPVFNSDDTHSASERADSFSRFIGVDLRTLDDADSAKEFVNWITQEDKQWADEKAAEQLRLDTL